MRGGDLNGFVHRTAVGDDDLAYDIARNAGDDAANSSSFKTGITMRTPVSAPSCTATGYGLGMTLLDISGAKGSSAGRIPCRERRIITQQSFAKSPVLLPVPDFVQRRRPSIA